MRYTYCLLVMLVTALATQVQSQGLAADRQMRVDVAYLASDLLGGRASGTPQGDEAASYIAERLHGITGLQPVGDSAGYFQRFALRIPGHHGATAAAPTLFGQNVLAYLDLGAQATMIIGAHFDHLGYGGAGSGSLTPEAHEPHNGADDNASGVAVLLDLAARLAGGRPVAAGVNYLFVAFDAEELGLVGSKHLVAHLPQQVAPVVAMINFDMVGRLSEERVLAVNGSGTSPVWEPLLDSLNAGRFAYRYYASGLGPSDHSSFYLADIPALHFFTGQHPQYHKPNDDLVLVNFEGMRSISDLVYELVQVLPQGGPAFAKTKDEGQREVSAFKVTMGIVPDYVYGGKGVRIDGILSERPAERAGLQRGDIIVRVDQRDIDDIYAYMALLGEHKTGDKVTVIVDRKGKRLSKSLTF